MFEMLKPKPRILMEASYRSSKAWYFDIQERMKLLGEKRCQGEKHVQVVARERHVGCCWVRGREMGPLAFLSGTMHISAVRCPCRTRYSKERKKAYRQAASHRASMRSELRALIKSSLRKRQCVVK